MITKLYVQMYPGHVIKPVEILKYDVIDDVIMSINMSKFWTAVTSLIFKLERRSKAQNVGQYTGYLDNILNIRWPLWRKSSPWPQIFVTFENFAIFTIDIIWHQM